MARPQLADYLDYREYLKDLFEAAREERPWFSLRYVGGRLDLDAGNLLKVLQKERYLPERCLEPLVAELGYTKQEAEHFRLLMEFAKAKSGARTQEIFEQILDLKYVRPTRVNASQYAFYKDWKPTAILALLHLDSINGSEAEIVNRLSPRATSVEVHNCIQLLEILKLIRKGKGNRWIPNESLLTTGDGWKDIAIREFQRQTLQLATRALDHVKPELRDISTLTITLGKNDLARIRELAKEFRRSVLKIASEAQNADRVYQLNIQTFPLSSTETTV